MSKRTPKPVIQFVAEPAGGATLMSERQKKCRKRQKDKQYRPKMKDEKGHGETEMRANKTKSVNTKQGKKLTVKMNFKNK